VVLGAESPVNVWEDWLVLEIYCAEDTTAYADSSLAGERCRLRGGLSAFSTFLAKKHGRFYIISR